MPLYEPIKITLTIGPSKEYPPDDDAMDATLRLVTAACGTLPTGKIVLTFLCPTPEDADETQERLRAALARRPAGVNAEMTTQGKERLEREKDTSRPMDAMWSEA